MYIYGGTYVTTFCSAGIWQAVFNKIITYIDTFLNVRLSTYMYIFGLEEGFGLGISA